MISPKQDSNRTGLSIAEELDLKVLPASPDWYAQEPNDYSDFGGDLTLVARSPINASRQQQKGGIVDLDASGGFNQDFTQSNMLRSLQGFFFADAREKPKSNPIATSTKPNANPVTGITGGTLSFTDDLAKAINVGDLLLMKGFASPLNAGVKAVTTGGKNDIAVTGIADDAAPEALASVEVCGHQFAADDVALTFDSGIARLTSAAFDLTLLGLTPGEWVFLGGDTVASRFAKPGYARIKSIDSGALVFDKTTWQFVAEAGTGKTIRVFYGSVFRNEKDPDKIKRRSYSLERTLGRDETGMQAEYLDGAVPNEMTINIPQAEKLNVDISYVAVDNQQVDGAEGLRAGDRHDSPGEALINTSSNVYRMRMSVVDPANTNPNPFFAYITEGTVGINNGIAPDKAVGVLGAFDTSADDFIVSGDVSAYFSTVAATKAIRQNADVSIDFIFAANNAGFVIDIPLLALGGGRLDVSKGESIKVPLDMSAAENDLGYTLMMVFFPYLPSVAIPK